jgi:hypothetical protein
MKTKIIGILVCMLLIATAVPVVTSIKNNVIPAMVPSHPQASMTSNWIETQKLLPEDGKAQAQFGGFVAIDGDTVLIGANQDFGTGGTLSGAAYVYVRTGTTWTQQAKLTASDAAPIDDFGWHLSLDGNTALVTAIWDDDNGHDSGSAYVFTRTGTTWTEQAKLTASDGVADDHFGYCSALDGDTAYIGANWDDDNGDGSGSLYVFVRSGTTWTQQAKLLALDGQAGDRFGGYVASSGDTALIGAYYDDDNGVDSGSVYVFTRSGTNWTQQEKFSPADGAAGDTFGQPICIDGDTAIIGSYYDDDKGNDSGSAYVFTRIGTIWTQQAKLLASDGAAGDAFTNYGISLDGDTALIAACLHDGIGNDSGSAYVFIRSGTTWTQQQKLIASDGAEGDMFATSVSLDGDTALLGAWYDDDNGVHSGSVYVFTKVGLSFSIAGGLGVKAVIKNNGTSDVNGIPWQIHLDGGVLGMINKTVNGTIDIPAGESKTVSTGMLLGLGGISIVARIAGMEKTATGTQLIILSIVPK